ASVDAPHSAEPVIGPRFARTRWLHAGYGSALFDAAKLIPHRRAVQVVFVRALDPDGGDLAQAQRAAARDMDSAVDLRRIAAGAALGCHRAGGARLSAARNLVDDHLLAAADLALEAPPRDRLLMLHEAVPALFRLVGDGRSDLVGERALHRLVAEA